MIKVRLATASDQPSLIEFIRDHWSATHVFTQNPELFAWQHRQSNGRLNFMLAEQTIDDVRAIIGILGFIPMGRFDDQLGDADVTLAIWKVVEEAPPGVGLRLLKQLTADLTPRLVAAIGISDIVKPIYGVLRYEVATLHHSALFNPAHRSSVTLAKNVPASAFDRDDAADPDSISFTRLHSDASDDVRSVVDSVARSSVPTKSWSYVNERFLSHPWYQYQVSLVQSSTRPAAVVVWREVRMLGTVALRIVDIIGEVAWIADARSAFIEELTAANAEYVDLMQFGVSLDVVTAGGFVSPSDYPGLIVPNYFSPFEQRNVSVDLAVKRFDDEQGKLRFFRADSDQDRPNQLQELSTDGSAG